MILVDCFVGDLSPGRQIRILLQCLGFYSGAHLPWRPSTVATGNDDCRQRHRPHPWSRLRHRSGLRDHAPPLAAFVGAAAERGTGAWVLRKLLAEVQVHDRVFHGSWICLVGCTRHVKGHQRSDPRFAPSTTKLAKLKLQQIHVFFCKG